MDCISLCSAWLCPPPCFDSGPQAEHESSCVSSSHACIWMSRAPEKVTSGKSLRQVRKNIPNKCLLTSCPTAILSPSDRVEFHELLFGRLKTKVHTQPLVAGRRGDLLCLWATLHRGKSESVSHGKSRPAVQASTRAP